jgi:hypothetical protein
MADGTAVAGVGVCPLEVGIVDGEGGTVLVTQFTKAKPMIKIGSKDLFGVAIT